jgi:hypothetical protein
MEPMDVEVTEAEAVPLSKNFEYNAPRYFDFSLLSEGDQEHDTTADEFFNDPVATAGGKLGLA